MDQDWFSCINHIYDIVSASPCNLPTLKKHQKNGQRLQTGEGAPWLSTGYQRTVFKGARETTSAVPESGDVQTHLESRNQRSSHSVVGTAGMCELGHQRLPRSITNKQESRWEGDRIEEVTKRST